MENAAVKTEIPVPSLPGDVFPAWENFLHSIKNSISSKFYDTFFSALAYGGMENGVLNISAPNEQIKNHLEKRYLTEMEQKGSEVFGYRIKISLSAPEEPKNDRPGEKSQNKGNFINQSAYPGEIKLNPKYTFDRFVKGPSNDHALAAAIGVSKKPGEYHNPMYLYGGVGLGKTHLLMAIGNQVIADMPFHKVMYVPAEIFQSDLVEAIQNNSMPHFKAKYRNVDVFLFDDIQFISQRAEATQEEIFHTFNYLYQNKKQVVISSDRPPHELKKLTDRLRSRFQSGLIVDIKPPNMETRQAILQAKVSEMKITVPPDVIKYIATNLSTQIRVLEAALAKLHFTSEVENHPIDLQMAKIALRDLPIEDTGSQVSIDEILRLVSKKFHVEEEEIKGNSRVETIVMARHICMYLAKKLIPSMSLLKIAQAFGKTDHTTVIHAEKKISEYMDSDEAIRVQILELEEELQF